MINFLIKPLNADTNMLISFFFFCLAHQMKVQQYPNQQCNVNLLNLKKMICIRTFYYMLTQTMKLMKVKITFMLIVVRNNIMVLLNLKMTFYVVFFTCSTWLSIYAKEYAKEYLQTACSVKICLPFSAHALFLAGKHKQICLARKVIPQTFFQLFQ